MEKTLLDEFAMAALTGMFSDSSRMATSDNYAREAYKYAQAMMEERKKHVKEAENDGWIEWHGVDQPVVDNVEVEVMYRNCSTSKRDCGGFCWSHNGSNSDIIKYRVLK